MKRPLAFVGGLAASVGLLAGSLASTPLAAASSHREAPAISNDPAADNTDLWAWVAPGAHDKTYIVASYIPLEGHANHAPMLAELRRIFDAHQSDGRVRFDYETLMHFGRVNRL